MTTKTCKIRLETAVNSSFNGLPNSSPGTASVGAFQAMDLSPSRRRHRRTPHDQVIRSREGPAPDFCGTRLPLESVGLQHGRSGARSAAGDRGGRPMRPAPIAALLDDSARHPASHRDERERAVTIVAHQESGNKQWEMGSRAANATTRRTSPHHVTGHDRWCDQAGERSETDPRLTHIAGEVAVKSGLLTARDGRMSCGSMSGTLDQGIAVIRSDS